MTNYTTDIEWVPLKISYVEYAKDDFIGKISALVSLSPLGIVCAFVALIIFRRDLHTITFFIGLLLNDLLSTVLKNLIAEHRPMVRPLDSLYSEYGMPSSHAQFMSYLTTYMFFFIFFRTNYLKTDFITYIWKSLTVVAFFIWAVLVCISRIYLRYHTYEQVICGVFVGTIFACVWFILTQNVFTQFYPVIASWKISEMLLIRDTTLIPNILWFEYTSTRQEVRSRRRKSDSRKSQ